MNMRTAPAAWRVAAITILEPGDLSSTLRGDDTAQWVEAAAGCGIAEAQIKLGRMLLHGDGVAATRTPPLPVFSAPRKMATRMDMPCWVNVWKMAGARKSIFRPPSIITACRHPGSCRRDEFAWPLP